MSTEKKKTDFGELLVCPRCSGRASDGLLSCAACRVWVMVCPRRSVPVLGRRVDGFTIRLATVRARSISSSTSPGLAALAPVLLVWLGYLTQPSDWVTLYFWSAAPSSLGFWAALYAPVFCTIVGGCGGQARRGPERERGPPGHGKVRQRRFRR